MAVPVIHPHQSADVAWAEFKTVAGLSRDAPRPDRFTPCGFVEDDYTTTTKVAPTEVPALN
jgi:hypothetical protein